MLEKELVAILACPVCKGSIQEHEAGLVCLECQLLFPIEDGVPLLLEERATRYQAETE